METGGWAATQRARPVSSLSLSLSLPFFRVQNQQSLGWLEADVDTRLEAAMASAFRSVWATAQARGLQLRTAAFVEALQRVTQAHLHRGFD